MVGDENERGGFRKRLIPGEDARLDMTVWTDDGQDARLLVQRARHPAHNGIGIEESVVVHG